MSTPSSSIVEGTSSPPRVVWGLAATAAAIGVIVYGVYGGTNGVDDQQASSMPIVIGIVLAASLVVFGLLLPRATRASANAAHWSLGFSIAALLAVAAFWSGMPVILGAASLLSDAVARRTDMSTSAVPSRLAILAIVASLIILGLGNTVFA